METLLIKNGYIVTETEVIKGDIFIEDEKISEISDFIDRKADQTIQAGGNLIFPGSIDAHTHMELPTPTGMSSDSFETGTLAALHGGTTTIIDFANQTKGKGLHQALKRWHTKAKNNCYTDYKFHVSVTDVNNNTLNEIINLYECQGIKSFKTFLTYDALKIIPDDLKKVMREVKNLGGLVTLHAETDQVIKTATQYFVEKDDLSLKNHPLSHPAKAEVDAIKTALNLARETGCSLYIVHLSTKDGLELIRKAKREGLHIYAETCPQYLLLNEALYQKENHDIILKYILCPPLRRGEDSTALWEGVIDKTIDVIATDHCPFTMEQKHQGDNDFRKVPNGIPGVENRFELMFSECVNKRKMTLIDFSKLMSTSPAKIFKMYPKKGAIKVGADADLVIFNKEKKHKISKETHHMNVDYNPYEGLILKGKTLHVIRKGKIVIRNEMLVCFDKDGEFVF